MWPVQTCLHARSIRAAVISGGGRCDVRLSVDACRRHLDEQDCDIFPHGARARAGDARPGQEAWTPLCAERPAAFHIADGRALPGGTRSALSLGGLVREI